LAGGHIGQCVQAQRVAGCHHPAHRAQRKTNQLVLARLQQGFVGAGSERVAARQLAGMEASQLAAPLVQCADGINTARELNVQVQASLVCRHILEVGQRIVMAGVQAQHLGLVIEHQGHGALQLGTQGFNLRSQARLCQALGPQQFVGKRGQTGGLTAVPNDQLVAHGHFPFLQLAPNVPVRLTDAPRSA
jgi:hypothetical protein